MPGVSQLPLIGQAMGAVLGTTFTFYRQRAEEEPRCGSRIRRKSKFALVGGDQLDKVAEEADPTDYGVQPDETQQWENYLGPRKAIDVRKDGPSRSQPF